jgi:hypothetical protein
MSRDSVLRTPLENSVKVNGSELTNAPSKLNRRRIQCPFSLCANILCWSPWDEQPLPMLRWRETAYSNINAESTSPQYEDTVVSKLPQWSSPGNVPCQWVSSSKRMYRGENGNNRVGCHFACWKRTHSRIRGKISINRTRYIFRVSSGLCRYHLGFGDEFDFWWGLIWHESVYFCRRNGIGVLRHQIVSISLLRCFDSHSRMQHRPTSLNRWHCRHGMFDRAEFWMNFVSADEMTDFEIFLKFWKG